MTAFIIATQVEHYCIAGQHDRCPACTCKCHRKKKRKSVKLIQDFHREAEKRLDEIERREADHSEHEGS